MPSLQPERLADAAPCTWLSAALARSSLGPRALLFMSRPISARLRTALREEVNVGDAPSGA